MFNLPGCPAWGVEQLEEHNKSLWYIQVSLETFLFSRLKLLGQEEKQLVICPELLDTQSRYWMFQGLENVTPEHVEVCTTPKPADSQFLLLELSSSFCKREVRKHKRDCTCESCQIPLCMQPATLAAYSNRESWTYTLQTSPSILPSHLILLQSSG